MPHNLSSDDEPLEDTTAAIPLRSKRTERKQRRKATRDKKKDSVPNLSRLPTELVLIILKLLPPSDVYNFAHTDRRFHGLVDSNASIIGDAIIRQRYTILSQCFPLPKLLVDLDPKVQPLVTDPARQKQLGIHKRPYQHVQPPDPHLVCTCLTCLLTWNNLGLVLDFAHWQNNLDLSEPLPTLPRGKNVDWNAKLIRHNASIVHTALRNSLSYARILEMHLDSTIRSIRRHHGNESDKRKHVDMTAEDAARGDDAFLQKAGPLSLEFPFNREEYYMLEAYLPNRWWKKKDQEWVYNLAGQHERDLEFLQRIANR
jgi:hypothetical protein